jgi:hypothetical protein
VDAGGYHKGAEREIGKIFWNRQDHHASDKLKPQFSLTKTLSARPDAPFPQRDNSPIPQPCPPIRAFAPPPGGSRGRGT